MLSGGEEGEVVSGDETNPEALVQALLSANAAVEGVTRGDEQACGVAVPLEHPVPLAGITGRDVQALGDLAIRTEHAGSFHGSTGGVGQSQANKLVLDNYLSVDGVGRVLLDESVEISLRQGRILVTNSVTSS